MCSVHYDQTPKTSGSVNYFIHKYHIYTSFLFKVYYDQLKFPYVFNWEVLEVKTPIKYKFLACSLISHLWILGTCELFHLSLYELAWFENYMEVMSLMKLDSARIIVGSQLTKTKFQNPCFQKIENKNSFSHLWEK